jgi:hypothetical protein
MGRGLVGWGGGFGEREKGRKGCERIIGWKKILSE